MAANDTNDLILTCWANSWGVSGIILVSSDEVFVLTIILSAAWGGMAIYVLDPTLTCNCLQNFASCKICTGLLETTPMAFSLWTIPCVCLVLIILSIIPICPIFKSDKFKMITSYILTI